MQPATADAGVSAAGPGIDSIREAFAAAERRRPGEYRCRHYCFAGRHVELHSLGSALAGYLGRAIAHLEDPASEGSPTDLVIRMLDAEVAGDAAGESGAWVSGDPNGAELLSDAEDHCLIRDARGQVHALLHRTRSEIIGVVRYGEQRPLLHDYGKPLQTLLAIWYLDRGVPLVHAGLVAWEGRGILLGGEGGSGKSTTSINCLRAGFDFLGDDRVGLSRDGTGFSGHSIFSSVLVDQQRLHRYPEIANRAIAPGHAREAKPLAFLHEIWPSRLPATVPVELVVLPRVVGSGESRLEPLSAAQALLELAPSSLILPMGPGSRGMREMAALLRVVPAMRLSLGEDEHSVPQLLRDALEQRRS